jgi:quinol monooxygenase YgiN
MRQFFNKITAGLLPLLLMLFGYKDASAQQKDRMVRMAKIEVDSVYLDEYKAALKEHTAAAIKSEPGVLTLYAMFEKQHPTKVIVLEIYASKEAYQAHLKSAHFIKYKSSTLKMVKSLELIELDPVALGAQPGFPASL